MSRLILKRVSFNPMVNLIQVFNAFAFLRLQDHTKYFRITALLFIREFISYMYHSTWTYFFSLLAAQTDLTVAHLTYSLHVRFQIVSGCIEMISSLPIQI